MAVDTQLLQKVAEEVQRTNEPDGTVNVHLFTSFRIRNQRNLSRFHWEMAETCFVDAQEVEPEPAPKPVRVKLSKEEKMAKMKLQLKNQLQNRKKLKKT